MAALARVALRFLSCPSHGYVAGASFLQSSVRPGLARGICTAYRLLGDAGEKSDSTPGAHSWQEPQHENETKEAKHEDHGTRKTSYSDHPEGDPIGGEEFEERTKLRVLNQALEFVPEYGWSNEALAEGAQAEGLSAAAAGMFEQGAVELVLHFVRQCNTQLREQLTEENARLPQEQDEQSPVEEFLRDALESRLRMHIPYMNRWSQAMGLLMTPQALPDSVCLLSELVDEIWFQAGDRSTDFNWYTRRGLLAAIYSATELVMVQDSSEDYEETWSFLEHRLANAALVTQAASQAKQTGESLVQGVLGAAITVKNLTGFNQRN
uniref:ubiquinone biosynthesis protein COQ9-B, mitochondrial-like n=1 Tax=Myxine glutinosa TaxID=7769 RepID=UPI00358F467A